MCLDLSSIINNIYHGTARAMNGPFTPDEWAYNPTVPVVPFDPQGAKRILNSVGWLDTDHDGVLDLGGKPFKFDLLIFAGSPAGLPLAQLYQEELKNVGIIANVVPYEPAQMFERVQSGNYDAAYMGWDVDPDPDQFAIFHSSQIPPRGQNWVFYSNPVADQLIEQGRHELDFSKRVKIYQRLHEVLAEDQPYTWAVQGSAKWVFDRSVRNVKEARGWGLFDWYPGEFDWWIPRTQRKHDGALAAKSR
jgi:peptide/nickel transport system substrate-binding protein